MKSLPASFLRIVLAVALASWCGHVRADEPPLPAGVRDIVKMAQAGLNDDLILAEIRSQGVRYHLSGEQVIALSQIGVSQAVIGSLLADDAAPKAEAALAAPPPPLPAPPPAPAVSTISVFVPARVRWVDSGIDLFPGQPVTITARGSAQYGRRRRDKVSPDGNPAASTNPWTPDNQGRTFVAPGLVPMSLVGKIGPFSDPFEIGAGTSFTAPMGGRLYLSMNDNNFSDNNGAWTVTVARPIAPPPGHSAQPAVGEDGGGAALTLADFRSELEPYGTWVQLAGYGWCWSPQAASSDPGWRPYCDNGQWVYADTGWFWQSDYPWGDVPFHYGRWFRDDARGWLWVPDYTWAPSWVCWRQAEADGCCGWAPLPPGAVFVVGQGLFFHGHLVHDNDFGLPWRAFVFVGFDHFWGGGYRRFCAVGDRAAFFYRRSVVLNGFHFDRGRFQMDGLGRDRIGRFTHQAIRVEDTHHLRTKDEHFHREQRTHEPPHKK